jgi:hypothetical protein
VLLEAECRAHADLKDPVRVLHDLDEGLRRAEDPAVVAVGIDLDRGRLKADRVERLADDLALALARHDADLFGARGNLDPVVEHEDRRLQPGDEGGRTGDREDGLAVVEDRAAGEGVNLEGVRVHDGRLEAGPHLVGVLGEIPVVVVGRPGQQRAHERGDIDGQHLGTALAVRVVEGFGAEGPPCLRHAELVPVGRQQGPCHGRSG